MQITKFVICKGQSFGELFGFAVILPSLIL